MSVGLATGEVIGPYRLLFPLGKGGMGEVWAARYAAAERFEKIVALKLIRAPHLDSQSVVMFFDEARAMLSLSHSGIVPTIDFGVDEGFAHIAMELVRGPSLSMVLRELAPIDRPIPPAIVASIGTRVATALDYAYRRAELDGRRLELIHRDVSPQNILIGVDGHVRLSDFGIARTAVQAHATAMGTMRGKPGYMSPEQIAGEPLDDRSDLFALATVLHECATARRLFWQKSAEATFDATYTEPAPRLDRAVPGFPTRLAEVIARGLEKETRDRPPTVGDFGRMLDEAASGIEGRATAEHDLAALVAGIFDDAAFDLDKQLRDVELGLADTIARESTPDDTEPEARVEPTRTVTWPVGVAFEDDRRRAPTRPNPAPFLDSPEISGAALAVQRRPWVPIVAASLLSAGLGAAGHALWTASTPDAPAPVETRAVQPTAPPPVRAVSAEQIEVAPPPPEAPKRRAKRRPPPPPPPAEPPPPTVEVVDPKTRATRAIRMVRTKDPSRATSLQSALVEAIASGDPRRIEAVAIRAERAAKP